MRRYWQPPRRALWILALAGCTDADWSFRARADAGDAGALPVDAASPDRPTPLADVPALDVPAAPDAGPADLLPPRPVAPLSTSVVGARRPTFRWQLAPGTDGARVEVCRERSCAAPVLAFEAFGLAAVPPSDLPTGTLYWRLRGREGAVTSPSAGAVWPVTISRDSAPVSAAWGSILDVNGDGLAELVVAASARSMVAGAAHLYLGSGAGVSPAASTTLLGLDGPGTGFASSLASAGDLNGDGFADLLVGSLGGGSVPPRAALYLGSATGLATVALSTVSAPEGLGGRAGVTVAAAGDVNADGYADALLGVPDAARASVYYGSSTGLPALPSVVLTPPGATDSLFGAAVAGACDFNADGYADIAVGSPGADRVDVFAGGRSGMGGMPRILANPDAASRSFGVAVVCAGDTNRDGYPDLAVGAPQATGGGRVYVYHGSEGGLTTSPSRVLTGPDGVGRAFGAALGGGGDLDGDGSADLIVGGGAGAIRVHVYLGGAAGLTDTPGVSLDAPAGNAGSFGGAVASVGDVNGDGLDDVLVGAGAESATPGVGTYPGSGRAYLYLGRASGLALLPIVTLLRPVGEFGFYGEVVAQREDPPGELTRPAATWTARAGAARRRARSPRRSDARSRRTAG